ncbi:MAG TPA: response regulator transcription factor [Gemmatimonadaceae bacterium]|nr:response regulator transcription factor [Gemmatimonadaceae bacterium]
MTGSRDSRESDASRAAERRPRILVVDDEPGTAELMAVMLTHAGFEVVQARDGFDAMARVRETPFDLILLDVMLPGLDGRETCRLLKEYGALGTRVVLHSSADEDDVDWRRAGADGFLQKPFDIRELPDFVRAHLAGE